MKEMLGWYLDIRNALEVIVVAPLSRPAQLPRPILHAIVSESVNLLIVYKPDRWLCISRTLPRARHGYQRPSERETAYGSHPHGRLRTFHQKSTCLETIHVKDFLVQV